MMEDEGSNKGCEIMNMKAADLIELLGLTPLPEEGGFYKETYRASGEIPQSELKGHEGSRNYSTAIYYLITPTEFSALHKLPQDEVFHFYLGDPVEMIQIDENGKLKTIIMGQDIKNSQQLQVIAPGNAWQGTRLVEGGSWALLGTTVAPGFDFKDFQVSSRRELIEKYPTHEKKIVEFTRYSESTRSPIPSLSEAVAEVS
ncbi:MAG: cupin domain-containing protein [Pseudomonadota bacterium]